MRLGLDISTAVSVDVPLQGPLRAACSTPV